jgi:hypothetical protein
MNIQEMGTPVPQANPPSVERIMESKESLK